MKYQFCLLISILSLISCSTKRNEIKNKTLTQKEISNSTSKIGKTHIIESDTAFIKNRRFIAFQDNELNVYILNDHNDTIFKNTDSPNKFEFIDFNEDGYPDILLGFISIYSAYELGLFDKDTNTFKIIEDFNYYPNANRIKNTKYYCSYTQAGCADSNWRSDLFYINNYKAYSIGSIEGIGCEDEEKNGIFIYKTNGEEQELIKSIPREPGYYEDKWEFIEDYWNKNYKLFEN